MKSTGYRNIKDAGAISHCTTSCVLQEGNFSTNCKW